MSVEFQQMVEFHRTGQHIGTELPSPATPGTCSALLAPYRRLARLRHDFPLVLVTQGSPEPLISLSDVIDAVLQEIAPPGISGKRYREHILRLETTIREQVADGAEGSLSKLWAQAEKALLSGDGNGGRELLRDSLQAARARLDIDGPVVGCDEQLPARLFEHLWAMAESSRTRAALERIDLLTHKLGEILKVDDLKAAGARTPQNLKNSLGERYQDAFDFELMSRLLNQATPQRMLPAGRRRRIQSALSVLETQKFFAARSTGAKRLRNKTQFRFVFSSVANALKAYRERLEDMAELVKAMMIAELEIDNRYVESAHDPFFQRFDAGMLGTKDLSLFPAYLICLHEQDCAGRAQADLMEILSSDLPMNIVIQVGDTLGEAAPFERNVPNGLRGHQLAGIVTGLGSAYVLQSVSAGLYQLRAEIAAGLTYTGPSLFSIFSGSPEMTPGLPPYLVAASAMESRAFPAFSFDPSAGQDLAMRFHVQHNPQIEQAWSHHELAYEDHELQRNIVDIAMTPADFAVTDLRYAEHFADVAPDSWNDDMVPVSDYLELDEHAAADKVPYVLVVDGDDILHRLVVDDTLIRVARRCGEQWRTLQEQGGINNSHAAALLARERASWEQEKAQELQQLSIDLEQTGVAAGPEPEQEPAGQAGVAQTAGTEEAEEQSPAGPSPDEAYIETPRCTTCDECTDRNNRMFAYDENKQAYIADLSAGTFRELVEAAESCQVCIIHPGKPLNPDEPGLDELVKRAELFH